MIPVDEMFKMDAQHRIDDEWAPIMRVQTRAQGPKISRMIQDAAEAEERFSQEELELFSETRIPRFSSRGYR